MNAFARFGKYALFGVAALIAGFASRSAHAQIRPLDDGPIHEAFVPAIGDVTALDAIEHEPPPDVEERVPPKPREDAVWIKGYWAWEEDRGDEGDWVWVGGSWRRPPPGRHWIDGFWREYDAGWVRVGGFWSAVPPDGITYIEDAPPEPFDEDPDDAPARNYFWLAGHWHYSPTQGYVQRYGKWVELDPNWILVPGHYVWRPDGYVYVNAYWDHPVDRRGDVYQSIYVEPAARVQVVYQPTVVVQPTQVVTWCYYSYPNYVYVLHHHYHHHHDWWHQHHEVPTWWGWHSWWGLRWGDHWGVWWWYTNPGYQHPHFVNASLAARIRPASNTTIIKVKNVVRKPVIVTNNGVISAGETLQIGAKGKVRDKDGGRKDKSAPLIVNKGSREKLAETAGKARKGDRKGGDTEVAALMPTGTQSARDEEDDPKKQPRRPRSGRAGTASGTPRSTDVSGDAGKGKSKGDDKDMDRKGKASSGPPIRSKTDEKAGKGSGKDAKGKDDDKPGKGSGGPPIRSKTDEKSGKGSGKDAKDKDDDKSGKSSSGKGGDKKGPPISADKSKDKDKDRDKDRDKDAGKAKDKSSDKSGGKSASPPTGGGSADRPREKSKSDDKAKGSGGGDKSSKKSGSSSGSGGSADKSRKNDNGLGRSSSGSAPKPPPTPPPSNGGSGERSKDKEKEAKKKDRD